MHTIDVLDALDYFTANASHISGKSPAQKQKHEGLYQKLCKGKKFTRGELVWMYHLGIWKPIDYEAWLAKIEPTPENQEHRDRLELFKQVQAEWFEIFESEDES